ncbi:caspase family protein [Nonomuraea sp. NPDC050643]|uniref:caspase, EACC1-associated type n=1 Tax=Nonomuraea sp. NPDC050643 TaxID=3155660 RepID=UPI0033CE30F1
MADETIRLLLSVIDDGADAQDLDQATVRLRDELLDLDVVVSAAGGGEVPEGARAVLSFTIGGLVIALAGSELLGAIVNAVTSWLNRNQHRSVKLDIEGDVLELTGVRAKEQRELVEVWLRRRGQAETLTPQGGRRMALIVAGDEYQDPGLRRLRAPALDAEALARVLGDEAIGGFDVRTMLNEPTAVVNEAVEDFFADRHPDDLLLLHFSGHGVKDDSGELYFATPSTKLNRLGATAVAAEFVNRRMSRSRCRRIVLLLDCCYAGAFARGALPRAGGGIHVEEQFGGRGRVVITASNALEYAFDGTELADAQEQTSPSVFTNALVEGLETGEADRDQDGYVGIHELYDYVYDRVRTVTPHQTPGKWTYDVQGDLVIARRSRPVERPAPLPNELQEAIDHPIAKIRAGTVDELARLRDSRHAGLALAARLALEALAHDDSRMVSAAAVHALGSVPQTPAPLPITSPPATAARAASVADMVAARTVSESAEARPRASGQDTKVSGQDIEVSGQRTEVSGQRTEVSGRGAEVRRPAGDEGLASGKPAAGLARDAGSHETVSGRPGVALVLRGLALVSALLLVVGPLEASPGSARFTGPFSGALPVWFLLLVMAAVGIAFLPEGRARAAALGAAAGLAALHLGLFARLILPSSMDTRPEALMTMAGALLVMLVVLLETATTQVGALRLVAAAAALLAVILMIIDLADPDMVAQGTGQSMLFAAALILTAALLLRAVQDWRAGRPRPAIAWSTTATVLIAGDILGIYADSQSEQEAAPAYLPVLLALLVVAAQATPDRTGLLTALQLVVIIGLVHNFTLVSTGPVFLGVLFIAAGCAGAAAYLTGLTQREATRPV